MIQTVEEILENVRALSKADREKLLNLIKIEESNSNERKEDWREKERKFQLSLKWIDEHRREFDGKFVVLDGGKLVACGDDSKTVYDEARAKGHKSPFLTRITAEDLPFGGW
jgi:hypothetical protein